MIEQPSNPRGPRSRAGFTMLEMLIVGMLGVLLVTFTCNATRWYTHSINELHVSAHLGGELKLAAAAIAQDLGRTIATQTSDGTDLQFDYDTNVDGTPQWDSPDQVIRYVRHGDFLIRRDLSDGSEVTIASNITTLSVSGDATNLNVYLVASYRNTVQDLTLSLPNP